MNSSMTIYQTAILQDDKHTPSTSTSATATHVKYTSAEPFTPKFVKDHLTTKSSRAQALYDERVRRRQLGLARRNQNRGANAMKKVKRGVVKREKMSRREAAEMGMWRLREEEARWDAFVPLHRLWLGYMSELLGLVESDDAQAQAQAQTPPAMKTAMPMAAGMHAKLVKADFHGSIMTVRRSKNAALVGASGIVVQETENTFKVVTRKDKLKVLPKQGSVFAFAVPLYSTESSRADSASASAVAAARSGTNSGTNSRGDDDTREAAAAARTVLDGPHIEFELYGNQFCFRAADRAGRKFKHKETIEL
ncbi:RNase P/MRP, p29 subunit [Russula ochroleuca]|uniref:Ribonuclease P protein subunit n=1 Tax=Russula ochroleuca TaxID=152965 RepID=A0A9P5JWI6_9AGAM|nr:RNase P/MRP, p29 subunit [Russula ochroleuca]